MTTRKKYRLRLQKLDLISAVSNPCQTLATCALIKSADATTDDFTATCAVAKVSDELGIVFGFALTSQVDGEAHFDLAGDAIDESELVRVAAEYVEAGAKSDQEHDSAATGRAVFVFPLTSEIADALSIETTKTGLLVGIKVSPTVLQGFKDKTYSGFSIAGKGIREPHELEKSDDVEARLDEMQKRSDELVADLAKRDAQLAAMAKDAQALEVAKAAEAEQSVAKRITTAERSLDQLVAKKVTASKLSENDALFAVMQSDAGRAAYNEIEKAKQGARHLEKSRRESLDQQLDKVNDRIEVLAMEHARGQQVYGRQVTEHDARKTVVGKGEGARLKDEYDGLYAARYASPSTVAEPTPRALEIEAQIGELTKSHKQTHGNSQTAMIMLEKSDRMRDLYAEHAAETSGTAKEYQLQKSATAPTGAEAQLERLAKSIAFDRGLTYAKAYAVALNTDEGKKLYSERSRS